MIVLPVTQSGASQSPVISSAASAIDIANPGAVHNLPISALVRANPDEPTGLAQLADRALDRADRLAQALRQFRDGQLRRITQQTQDALGCFPQRVLTVPRLIDCACGLGVVSRQRARVVPRAHSRRVCTR